MPPVEVYEIVDGNRVDMPSGDTPTSGTQQESALAANGTGVPAATDGEASSAAPERSAPQTQETSPAGEAGDAAALDDDLSDVDDDVATIPYVNRRIKQLNAKRRATERQLAEERHQHAMELAQLRGQQEAVQRMLSGAAPAMPETPAQPTGPPQVEQYASHEDFVYAVATYATEQRFQQQRQQEQQRAFQVQLMEREQLYRAQHPDFDSVVRLGLAGKVSPVLQQALMLVPDGPAVAYTLAQQGATVDANGQTLLQRFNSLPPPLLLVELGRLVPPPQPTTLAAPAVGSTNGTGTTPSAQTLHAPETPLSGSGGGAPVLAYNDNMSQEDYRNWRKRTSQLDVWKNR